MQVKSWIYSKKYIDIVIKYFKIKYVETSKEK